MGVDKHLLELLPTLVLADGFLPPQVFPPARHHLRLLKPVLDGLVHGALHHEAVEGLHQLLPVLHFSVPVLLLQLRYLLKDVSRKFLLHPP